MRAFDIRMLAFDKRDAAIHDRLIARSYLREGSIGMHKHIMRRAIKSWKRFKELLEDAREIA